MGGDVPHALDGDVFARLPDVLARRASATVTVAPPDALAA